jgi:hypothetical protein
MPVIDLSSSVVVARLYGTWLGLPLICDERLAEVLSLKRRERYAADAESAVIANAHARYNTTSD